MRDSEGPQIPSDVFMELASDTRCNILKMLHDKPAHASNIVKTLKLTKQDTHRNTSRLTEAGIIRKNSDGLFSLTEYGRLVVEQIQYYQFLYKYKKFFEDHTCDLPLKFKQRLGVFNNCELVTKVTNVQQRIKKIESEAKNHIKLIVSQAWEDEGKTLLERVKNGVKISTIFGFDSVMPDEIVENIQKKLTGFIQKGDLEQKIVDGNVKISLFIADQDAAVMFPNQKGEIDMNTVFVGRDPEFYEWCNDYFEHLWNMAKPIVKGRTKFY